MWEFIRFSGRNHLHDCLSLSGFFGNIYSVLFRIHNTQTTAAGAPRNIDVNQFFDAE